MMIFGAHIVLYTTDAEADRAFFSNVLGLKSVDAGHGWPIFALPPAEVACHPFGENGVHELFFMCNDLNAEMASLSLYQPKHPIALAALDTSVSVR
jgi:catechol 2,3-dioxygenase-like lactoylglutathione lyase family enzyme